MCDCEEDWVQESHRALYDIARDFAQKAGNDPDIVADRFEDAMQNLNANVSDLDSIIAVDDLDDDRPTDNLRTRVEDYRDDDSPIEDGVATSIEDYRDEPDQGFPVGQPARDRLTAGGDDE